MKSSPSIENIFSFGVSEYMSSPTAILFIIAVASAFISSPSLAGPCFFPRQLSLSRTGSLSYSSPPLRTTAFIYFPPWFCAGVKLMPSPTTVYSPSALSDMCQLTVPFGAFLTFIGILVSNKPSSSTVSSVLPSLITRFCSLTVFPSALSSNVYVWVLSVSALISIGITPADESIRFSSFAVIFPVLVIISLSSALYALSSLFL